MDYDLKKWLDVFFHFFLSDSKIIRNFDAFLIIHYDEKLVIIFKHIK